MANELMVALDTTQDKAIELIDILDNVSSYKIGLELVVRGCLHDLIQKINQKHHGSGHIFLDLKFTADIENTIECFTNVCIEYGIQYISFIESMGQLSSCPYS